MAHALAGHAEAIAAAGVASILQGAQTALKALPGAIDLGAARVFDGLAIPGSVLFGATAVLTPENVDQVHETQRAGETELQYNNRIAREHGLPPYTPAHSSPKPNLDEARQFREPIALTVAGARAIADVKNNCDPNDFKAFSGANAHDALRQGDEHAARLAPAPPRRAKRSQRACIWHRGDPEHAKRDQSSTATARKITAVEATNPRKLGIDSNAGTVRDWLKEQPYEFQRDEGIKTIRRAMKEVDLSTNERNAVDKQLHDLEHGPNPCSPEKQR